MRLELEQIDHGEDEVILRYREMNGQVEAIAAIARGMDPRICASMDGVRLLLRPEEIFYVESVDGGNFAYLADQVCRVSESLGELAAYYGGRGFFRCSKSMVLNIHKISRLKSEPGNRIRATMENGEQVMISRKYAGLLRRTLQGGRDDEE